MTQTNLTEGLNPEQVAVVEHDTGPALVVAVAGAGKTKALVHRIAYLIEVRGVNPRDVLAVTFSTKAAAEMNERLAVLGVTTARVGTWHSVCWEILREEREDVATWEVDSKDRYRVLMKIVLGYQNMHWKNADLTTVLQYVGRCKACLARPGTAEAIEVARAYYAEAPCTQRDPHMLTRAYFEAEEARLQRRLITFDDMLVGAWEELNENEDARCRWASRWTYVLQDEAQDQNGAQMAIAELLAKDHRNYMLVGDPAQSIYGFRGAVPEKLLAFEKDWGAKVIKMHRNYRSGRQVIDAANCVIRAMDPATHLGVEMQAELGTEATIVTKTCSTMDEEGRTVALELQELKAGGAKWSDMAVLYRTNAQSRGVEEACISARIPYVVVGGTNFYSRKEVADLLSYLRVAAGRGTFAEVKRSINAPFRFLGKAFQERVEFNGGLSKSVDWTAVVRSTCDEARVQSRQRGSAFEWAALIDTLKHSIERCREEYSERGYLEQRTKEHDAPAALLERIVKETDYFRFITRDEGAETTENNRVSNVRELVRAAERFVTVDEMLDYIDQVQKASKKKNGKRDCVTLMSLHRSKGLEFNVVCMIGVNEKILPHGRASDLGEERRLFYVGVTRARQVLYLTHVEQAAYGDKVLPLFPSQFLAEAGLQVAS